jgi:hypothetical protein
MTYADELRALRESRPDLAGRVERFRTLEHILDWIKRDGHPLADLDLVTQDEFCHDFLMPVGPDWLVFGVT